MIDRQIAFYAEDIKIHNFICTSKSGWTVTLDLGMIRGMLYLYATPNTLQLFTLCTLLHLSC